MQQQTYPSWLYSVVNGATSIWERLNSYTVEQGFGGNNSMNSFNHYSFGAVAAWGNDFLPVFQHAPVAAHAAGLLLIHPQRDGQVALHRWDKWPADTAACARPAWPVLFLYPTLCGKSVVANGDRHGITKESG